MKYASLSATVGAVQQHMVCTNNQQACRSIQIRFFSFNLFPFDHDFPVNSKQYVVFSQSCDAFSYLAAEYKSWLTHHRGDLFS